MSAAAIHLEDVRRAFGPREVLRGVSGTIERGRVVGLLGRNGEGKTTLFKVLLDLLAADAGRIEVLGARPDGTGALRARVGYVPERPAFHGFMTIAEVLALRARFFPSWNARRASELCARLGLEPALAVAGASKGTLAKLAWVCAAAHEPELFLLDEPTSGLDALVRDDLLEGLVAELQDAGRTILVANHRMEELSGLLDEVWVLREGRIERRVDVDALRTGACRLRGRLKPGARVEGLAGTLLRIEGPLVEVAALEPGQAEAVAAAGRLESLERQPLPLAEAFKILLSEGK